MYTRSRYPPSRNNSRVLNRAEVEAQIFPPLGNSYEAQETHFVGNVRSGMNVLLQRNDTFCLG